MRLHRLEVSGFRGINEPIKLDPAGKSLLLVGENGVGKTSLLQAIEWALLGDVTPLEGDEFRREDALVNLFNEDKVANVKIEGNIEKGASLMAIRTRKRLAKTKGRSSLEVHIDGQAFKAQDAEKKLMELLGISPEEYSTTVHLHQEVIRELVEGDERDRSKAINKILGMDLLSSFGDILTKQLHSSSSINKSFRALQTIVGHLGNQRKTIEDSMIKEEKALESTRDRLREKGVNVGKLDQAIDLLFSEAKQVMVDTAKEIAAQKLALRLSRLETPVPELDKLAESLDNVMDIKRELASTTQQLITKAQNEIVDLDLLHKQQVSYLTQISGLKIKEKSEIDSQMKNVSSKLEMLVTQLRDSKAKERQLKDLKDDAQRILDRIDELNNEIEGITKSFGDENVITQKQLMLGEQESQLKKDLDRVGIYNNLLSLAKTFIEVNKQNVCPVCERPAEYEDLLSSIQKRISEELAKHAEDLRQRLQKVKEDKEKTAEALKKLKSLKKTLDEFTTKLGEVKKRFYEITRLELMKLIPSSIENQIGELRKGIDENEQKTEELSKLMDELKRAQTIIENLTSVEKKIGEALSISGNSAELSEALLKHIESKSQETQKLRLIDKRLGKLNEKINLLEDIATLLRRSASLNALEKSLKEIDEKLSVQQGKLQRLQALVEALTDIRDAANSVKMEALEDILSSIGNDINTIYSKLLGHPFFIRLQLVPEEERDTHIYRIVAQSKDQTYSTYVRTRFSQTQRNLVAISLFLAMAKRTSTGLVILDDPSQSLDFEHKRAFIEVLQAIMQEIQVIVATQDKTLMDQMLKVVPSQKLRAYKLSRWSEKGPVIQEIR